LGEKARKPVISFPVAMVSLGIRGRGGQRVRGRKNNTDAGGFDMKASLTLAEK
jgi:hypothetical protein